MSKFWKRVIDANPELIGSVVYFSPTKRSNLACVIGGHGTVSPVRFPYLKFASIVKLLEAWKKGEVVSENGSALKTRHVARPHLDFGNDFFFHPGRRNSITNIFRKDKKERRASTAGTDDALPSSGDPGPTANVSLGDAPATGHNADQFDTTPNFGQSAAVAKERMNSAGGGLATALKARLVVKQKPCPGLDRRRHEEALKKRQWDGARTEFSPVFMDSDRCWSKTCQSVINDYQRLCWDCKVAQKRLWQARRYLKKGVNEENRICCTSNRWLTAEEKAKKQSYKLAHALLSLRNQTREKKLLQKEMMKRRPDHVASQIGVGSVTKNCNEEMREVQSPKCQWLENDDEPCGYGGTSISDLLNHIRHTHIMPQWEQNKERPQSDRVYMCRWHGCVRVSPFGTLQSLRYHVTSHSDHGKTQDKSHRIREHVASAARPLIRRKWQSTVRKGQN